MGSVCVAQCVCVCVWHSVSAVCRHCVCEAVCVCTCSTHHEGLLAWLQAQMSRRSFKRHASALVEEFNQRDNSLVDELIRHWGEIASRRYTFNNHIALSKAVQVCSMCVWVCVGVCGCVWVWVWVWVCVCVCASLCMQAVHVSKPPLLHCPPHSHPTEADSGASCCPV